MARYKVMGMKKGSLVVVGTFANKRDAEGFIRMTQRSAKVGSLSIEDGFERKPEAQPKMAGATAVRGTPVESVQFIAQIDAKAGNPLPFAAIISIGVLILAGGLLAIEGLNSLLANLK